jgi:hypothetical protein
MLMQKRRSNARRTADVRVIHDVLLFAKTRGLALPVAVETYRSELREGMQRARTRRKEAPSTRAWEMAERHRKRLLNESARVSRLQRTYPSWRGDVSLAGLVRWWESATAAARQAESNGRSEAHCTKLWRVVWQAEDAMRRAGI